MTFHLAMKPFYQVGSAGIIEAFSHRLHPLWESWMRRQKPPAFEVAYGIPGDATELFDIADRTGAFKLFDSTNSHPCDQRIRFLPAEGM